MKIGFRVLSLALIIVMLISFFGCAKSDNYETVVLDSEPISISDIDTGDISVNFRADGKYFYQYKAQGQPWEAIWVKGVNMGLTEATTDLDNPNTSYETYISWFEQISSMNANTVKVFSIMNPDFYKALYDFNSTAKSPIYLIQGIWFNENYLYDIGDALDKESIVLNSFIKAIKETVSIIHGDSNDTSYGEWSPAVYSYDISKYLVGYVLGLEWPADFVITTNDNHKGKTYRGDYLYTSKNASPFEAFLATVGDELISYETKRYNAQTPIAFLNWSTTDPLEHTNEPFDEEDAVGVDTENILSTEKYYSKQFAAIDIYPYYPEFLNHQEEYTSYIDQTGKANPYRAYLKDLLSHYTVPVMVAEFGVPTSRGKAHNSVMGYNQGGVTEQQQGQYIAEMVSDIFNEGYCGAVIFSWQDEWFKQTWNTVKYSPQQAIKRTPNVMSAEQSYGILAFEPGTDATCYVDGDFSDWDTINPLVEQGDYQLYFQYDAGYVYLFIKSGTDLMNKKLTLPIQTIGVGSGFNDKTGVTFSDKTDFILELNGKNSSRVLVDSRYDVFDYIYAVQKQVFPSVANFSTENTGKYNEIYMFLSNEIVLPVTNKTIAPTKYESGALTYGNANPNADDYNSLADFYSSDEGIEIRIPWYLLNVVNSAEKTAITIPNGEDVSFGQFNSIKIGIADSDQKSITLHTASYNGIAVVEYHSRLKKSYDTIAKALKALTISK